MPQLVSSQTRILEESLDELNKQVKAFSSNVNFILDGEDIPDKPRHAIAVLIDNSRARAHITRVCCTDDNRIVCWATATSERHPSLMLYINMTYRKGEWRVSFERARAFGESEDAIEMS